MSDCTLVTTSFYVDASEIEKAKKNIKRLGFTQVNHISSGEKYHNKWAGTPTRRIKALQKAFKGTESCIIATRGGSGVIHILDKLDYTDLQKKPKTIVGYSDLTPLLNNVFEKTNIITLHGPMGLRNPDKESKTSLQLALAMENHSIPFKYMQNTPTKNVKGILKGGNLAMCAWSLGSDFEIDLKNKIIFFEDIGTDDFIAHNRLVQLKNSRKFKPKALLFGYLDKVKHMNKFAKSVAQLFPDIPIIYNLPFGHQLPNITMPIGAKAEIDVQNKQIHLIFPKEAESYAVKLK